MNNKHTGTNTCHLFLQDHSCSDINTSMYSIKSNDISDRNDSHQCPLGTELPNAVAKIEGGGYLRYGDILKSSVNANNLFVCCVYVEPTLVGKMGALPMVTVVMVGEVVTVVAHSTSAGYNECD